MALTIAKIAQLLEDDFEECGALLPRGIDECGQQASQRPTVKVEPRQPIRYDVDKSVSKHLIFAHLHMEESVLHKIASETHRVKFTMDATSATASANRVRGIRNVTTSNKRDISDRIVSYDQESELISLANSMSSVAAQRSATAASQLYPSSAMALIDGEHQSSFSHNKSAKIIHSVTSDKPDSIPVLSESDNALSYVSGTLMDTKKLHRRCCQRAQRTKEKSPFSLIVLISYPMVLGYLSVSLYILFAYELVTDTTGLRNLTGMVYFAPLEQILITQFYLAFGSSAGTLMEQYYSQFKHNYKDVQARIMSEKIVAYYFLFGLNTSLLIPCIMVPAIRPILRSFTFSPKNHYDYTLQTLEYAYPIISFGPLVYFMSSGLVPVLRNMNLGIYCLVRQLIGGAIFLVSVNILIFAFGLDNSGAAWGIILGELCSGLFFLFNFLEVFHLRTKMFVAYMCLRIRSRCCSKSLRTSSLLTTTLENSMKGRHKGGPKSLTMTAAMDDIPRIYLKAHRYGNFNWSLFGAFVLRGVTNYLGYLTPPLTAMVGIIQHYKYGGENAHRRQIATGLASRYLGTFQSPLTGLIAGITNVIDYYWSSKQYIKFKKAFYASLLIMFLFTLIYTVIFETCLPFFVESYKMGEVYQQNMVKNSRIVFSFITFQTPFYIGVIMAQVFQQNRVSILLTFSRLAIAISWNVLYPLVSHSTTYMIHGIAIADIAGGIAGFIYLMTKAKYMRRAITAEATKNKKELTIHKFASMAQLEKVPKCVYASLLNKVDDKTYEIQGDDVDLDESTEIGYVDSQSTTSRQSLLGPTSLSRVQSVQYLSRAEEESMSAAHIVTTVPTNHHHTFSIEDIAHFNEKPKRSRAGTSILFIKSTKSHSEGSHV